MGRFFKVVFVLIFLALIGIQFVEVNRTNPPITGEIQVPPQLKEIFKKSCYDCHSNETKWAWYSYVAPISWLISNDVEEGRKDLNFSEWEKYYSRKKEELKKEIWEEVRDDKMPMGIYIYTHPSSKLDLTQKNVIKRWAAGEINWK